MTPIAISRLHFPITTLGPGCRIGLWMQGCSIHCPGCISADTWAKDRGIATVDALLSHLEQWMHAADGITISGGEPFDQPEALEALLRGIRLRTSSDILVYSGYAYEALKRLLLPMSGQIDALIADPFVQGHPQTLPLRGSDNQRLHLLTSMGEQRFAPFLQPTSAEPSFDVMFDDEGEIWFAGVPSQQAFVRIARTLEEAGHRVATSQDQSALQRRTSE